MYTISKFGTSYDVDIKTLFLLASLHTIQTDTVNNNLGEVKICRTWAFYLSFKTSNDIKFSQYELYICYSTLGYAMELIRS